MVRIKNATIVTALMGLLLLGLGMHYFNKPAFDAFAPGIFAISLSLLFYMDYRRRKFKKRWKK